MPETTFPDPSTIDLVIYHGNCPDGFGAAFAAYLRVGDQAEYVPAMYGMVPPDVKGKNVAIVDFSYSREDLERMLEEANSLVVLDHHKTAEEALLGFDNALFDMNQSGAVLAYRWFHFTSESTASQWGWERAGLKAISCETEVPLFFQYLQDRDLWTWKLPFSREFSAALSMRKFDFRIWMKVFLETLSSSRLESLFNEGRQILAWRDEELKSLAKKAHPIRIGDTNLMALNYSGKHHSDLGHILCEMGPGNIPAFGASLTWFYDAEEGVFRCSLRSSNSGPSILEIAEKFGGGGHIHAAGFEFDGDIREILMGGFWNDHPGA